MYGAVSKPGSYDIVGGRDSIQDILSQAGGMTTDAAPEVIFTPAETAPNAPATLQLAGNEERILAEPQLLTASAEKEVFVEFESWPVAVVH